jgi:hypothetical protein
VDAELAHGAVTPFDADFAADGVDELIMGFFGRGTADPVAGPRTLQVVAADAGQQWQATLIPDGARTVSVRRGDGAADATLTGPASALYLLLWNRAPAGADEVRVTGDADLLKSWRDGMRVRWS